MQPWKISVGLTAIVLALALMIAGESFAYLELTSGSSSPITGMPIAWYGGQTDLAGKLEQEDRGQFPGA